MLLHGDAGVTPSYTSEQERAARRADRRQRRADDLAAAVAAVRAKLSTEYEATGEAMDAVAAAAGKRRREADAAAKASFRPGRCLADYGSDRTPAAFASARGNIGGREDSRG